MLKLNQEDREYIRSKNSKVAVALGTFDGLHIGHKQIIQLALENEKQLPCVVLTFSELPSFYFGGKTKALMTQTEKEEGLKALHVDRVITLPFDDMLANCSAADFLNFLADELNAGFLSAGFNYTFGKNAEGTASALERFGKERDIAVKILPPVMHEGLPVSSTRIREALSDGDILTANTLLGRSYSFFGVVIGGKMLGRKIGFPTINIDLPDGKIFPKNGVYTTKVEIDGITHMGMTNVGRRPTVERNGAVNTETNIIDFKEDVYGKTAKISFLNHIREEQQFKDVKMLVKQLEKDRVLAIKQYLDSDFTEKG